jgi:hypothetical protein
MTTFGALNLSSGREPIRVGRDTYEHETCATNPARKAHDALQPSPSRLRSARRSRPLWVRVRHEERELARQRIP